MRENKYRIVDATTKDCMVVPIYDDGGGRLEDRSLYADQGGVSISVGKAIGFDINIVGAQIIKRIGDDVVAYECYLGTPSDMIYMVLQQRLELVDLNIKQEILVHIVLLELQREN